MRRWFLLTLGGPLLIWASTSWAVSKVGGGILWNDDAGFLSSIPLAYDRSFIALNQDVTFNAKPVIREGILIQPYIVAELLQNELPQWMGRTDRQEFHDHYVNSGWKPLSHTDPCVEQMEKINGLSMTRILSWGDGRGVIFNSIVGNKSDVIVMSESVQPFSGVCSWK